MHVHLGIFSRGNTYYHLLIVHVQPHVGMGETVRSLAEEGQAFTSRVRVQRISLHHLIVQEGSGALSGPEYAAI